MFNIFVIHSLSGFHQLEDLTSQWQERQKFTFFLLPAQVLVLLRLLCYNCGSIAPIRVYTAQNYLFFFFSLQLEYLTLKMNSVIWYRLPFIKARTSARCATLWPCVGITRGFFLIVTWFKWSLAVAQRLAAKACKRPESALGFVASHVTKCLFPLSFEWIFGAHLQGFSLHTWLVCAVFLEGVLWWLNVAVVSQR